MLHNPNLDIIERKEGEWRGLVNTSASWDFEGTDSK
jgi:hypothetical protein